MNGSNTRRWLLILNAVAVAVVLSVAITFFRNGDRLVPDRQQPLSQRLLARLDAQRGLLDLRFDQAGGDAAEVSISSDMNLEQLARALVGNVEEVLQDIEDELVKWDRQVEPLLANQLGKLIVVNGRLMDAFVSAYRANDPQQGRVLVAAVKEHLQSLPTKRPGKPAAMLALVNHLQALRKELEETLEGYRRGREAIASVVAEASKPTTGMTLKQVLESYASNGSVVGPNPLAAKAKPSEKEVEQVDSKSTGSEKGDAQATGSRTAPVRRRYDYPAADFKSFGGDMSKYEEARKKKVLPTPPAPDVDKPRSERLWEEAGEVKENPTPPQQLPKVRGRQAQTKSPRRATLPVAKRRDPAAERAIAFIQSGTFPGVAGPVPDEALDDRTHPAWLEAKRKGHPTTVWYRRRVALLLRLGLNRGQSGELFLHAWLTNMGRNSSYAPIGPLGSPSWEKQFTEVSTGLRGVCRWFPHAFLSAAEGPQFGKRSLQAYPSLQQELAMLWDPRGNYGPTVCRRYGLSTPPASSSPSRLVPFRVRDRQPRLTSRHEAHRSARRRAVRARVTSEIRRRVGFRW